MFADLGHFSYTAIQVLLSEIPLDINFLHLSAMKLMPNVIVVDCFYFPSISLTDIGIHGPSRFLVNEP